MLVWMDGVPVDPHEARISIFDRGFLYGQAVFETLRTYGGRIWRPEAHMERLFRSATTARVPISIEAHALVDELTSVYRASGLDEATLRMSLTAGQGETFGSSWLTWPAPSGEDSPPRRITWAAPIPAFPSRMRTDGLTAITVRAEPGSGLLGTAKTHAYLMSIVSRGLAKDAGADDAVIVGLDGHVREASSANVFLVFGDSWVTPPVDDGALAGVTRESLMEALSRVGSPVTVRPVSSSELHRADEVVVTSSVRGLRSVVRIDGRAVGSGRPGPKAAQAEKDFMSMVRAELGLREDGAMAR